MRRALLSLLAILSSSFLTTACSSSSSPSPTTNASTDPGYRLIQYSVTTVNMNMGVSAAAALAYADGICVNDFGTGYKALLGSSLRAAPATDWPLSAAMEYRQADGITVIGTTTAGAIFTFPLTNPMGSSSGSSLVTGITTTWVSDTAHNCLDWTSNSSSQDYHSAINGNTDDSAIDQGTGLICSIGNRPLICVQQ